MINVQEAFGFTVRIAGLGTFMYGVMYFNSVVYYLIGIPADGTPDVYFVSGLLYCLEGAALMLSAGWLSKVCYRAKDSTSEALTKNSVTIH